MRRLSANYIFTGKTVLKNGIIELDDTGKIIHVIDTCGQLKETASLEYYNGVLVPGFINAHCHLELSHMKGVINSQTVSGLPGFLDEIISKRSFPDDLQEKIFKADKEMQMNGIVAVGDISNTCDSLAVKQKSSIYYHTFVETFTVDEASSDEAFKKAVDNLEQLRKLGLPGTIVPHASYSVPNALYDRIRNFEKDTEKIVSIHNQETASEDEFIKGKTGALADVLKKKGFNFPDFIFKERNSIEYTMLKQHKGDTILLIHNTFSDEHHMDYAERFSDQIYWVLCPLSNLYIEKTLPDVSIFFQKGLKTCIGTDSYTSNNELSILSELKSLTQHFPEIPFEKLIESACINGAKALKIDNRYGSIEPGKTPGINLIEGFDFEKMHLKETSKIRVIHSPGKL